MVPLKPHQIFAQIFTIEGLRKRTEPHKEVLAIPLVYALLSGKKTELYRQALEVVKEAVDRYCVTPLRRRRRRRRRRRPRIMEQELFIN